MRYKIADGVAVVPVAVGHIGHTGSGRFAELVIDSTCWGRRQSRSPALCSSFRPR